MLKFKSPASKATVTGQVEAVNKTLKASTNKRLEEAKGRWPEELPNVLR